MCILATACTRDRRFTTASGHNGFVITCPRAPEKCFLRAAHTCPNGYNILDSQGRETGEYVLGGARAMHPEYIVNHQLKIACGAPP
jgi:hypothetical protein